jgi:hypothetical protein
MKYIALLILNTLKSNWSGLENREYGCRDPSFWPRDTTLYPQKLALTSPTSGGRSVGIVRSRTKATEKGKKKSNWIQPVPSHSTSSRSTLILPSHLGIILLIGFLTSCFQTLCIGLLTFWKQLLSSLAHVCTVWCNRMAGLNHFGRNKVRATRMMTCRSNNGDEHSCSALSHALSLWPQVTNTSSVSIYFRGGRGWVKTRSNGQLGK